MTVLEYFERRQAMKNGEGYSVPTEGEAIRRASFLPDAVWDVIKAIRHVLRLTRLRIVYIKLVDVDTRKEYTWED